MNWFRSQYLQWKIRVSSSDFRTTLTNYAGFNTLPWDEVVAASALSEGYAEHDRRFGAWLRVNGFDPVPIVFEWGLENSTGVGPYIHGTPGYLILNPFKKKMSGTVAVPTGSRVFVPAWVKSDNPDWEY